MNINWEKIFKLRKIFVFGSKMLHIHNNFSAINSIFKTRVYNRNLSLKINHHAVNYITIGASHSFLLVNENKTTSCTDACLSTSAMVCLLVNI